MLLGPSIVMQCLHQTLLLVIHSTIVFTVDQILTSLDNFLLTVLTEVGEDPPAANDTPVNNENWS